MQQAVRDVLIAFMAATAQAQAEVTKEAQRAGIEHAKALEGRYRGGEPSYSREQLQTVQALLGQEAGTSAIAKATGLTRQTVLRIRADPGRRGEPRHLGAMRPPWSMCKLERSHRDSGIWSFHGKFELRLSDVAVSPVAGTSQLLPKLIGTERPQSVESA